MSSDTVSNKEAHVFVFSIYRQVMDGYGGKDPYSVAIVQRALKDIAKQRY